MQTKEVFNRFREMIEERTRPCIQHLEGAPYAYVWGEITLFWRNIQNVRGRCSVISGMKMDDFTNVFVAGIYWRLPLGLHSRGRCPWSETSRGMPGLKASSCIQRVSSLGMWGELWCVLWELCLCIQRVSSLGDFGVSCTLHPKAWDHLSCILVGASHSGDRNASNIWGKSRLYLRLWCRETAGNGALSLAREMRHPWSPEIIDEPWAFVTRPHRRTLLKLVEDRTNRHSYWASEWET